MIRRLFFVARMFFCSLGMWPARSWVRFWFGQENCVEIDGLQLRLRKQRYLSKIADLAMAWEVLVDGVYDKFPIRQQDTVLDIGGHLGSFSLKAARTGASVYTFEPFGETYGLLESNTKPFKNVTIYNEAVTGTDGESTFYYNDNNPAENSIYRSTGKSIRVPTISLQTAISRCASGKIDVLKVDCEGAEYAIFHNATAECLANIASIVMEVHDPRYFDVDDDLGIDGLIQLLQNNGFDATFQRENRYQGYIFAQQVNTSFVGS